MDYLVNNSEGKVCIRNVNVNHASVRVTRPFVTSSSFNGRRPHRVRYFKCENTNGRFFVF